MVLLNNTNYTSKNYLKQSLSECKSQPKAEFFTFFDSGPVKLTWKLNLFSTLAIICM